MNPYAQAFVSLWNFYRAAEKRAEVAERDKARLLGHIGTCAAAVIDKDLNEAYHQCYMAIVKDLDLPAETQSKMMTDAIDAAMRTL